MRALRVRFEGTWRLSKLDVHVSRELAAVHAVGQVVETPFMLEVPGHLLGRLAGMCPGPRLSTQKWQGVLRLLFLGWLNICSPIDLLARATQRPHEPRNPSDVQSVLLWLGGVRLRGPV